MKKRSLVIFDLDGTLVNSIYDLADAVNSSLEEFGYPVHEVSEYYHFVGNGTVKLCERALPESNRSEDEIMRLHTAFADRYNKCCTNKTKIYEGIIPLLESLKAEGVKCAVASNKTDRFVKYIVSELFPSGLFDMVVGKKEGVPTKPDPQIILDIIGSFGYEKSGCLMVGDSDVDVVTAHNGGIECVGCSWGFRGAEELVSTGADYIVNKPQEIIKYCI